MSAKLVTNADRMMTSGELRFDGIEVTFADGQVGLVPFREIPGLDTSEKLAKVELPNPYEVVLHTESGEMTGLTWDFVRHYCDSSYRARVEAVALAGRQSIGVRIRQFREASKLTQVALGNKGNVRSCIQSGD